MIQETYETLGITISLPNAGSLSEFVSLFGEQAALDRCNDAVAYHGMLRAFRPAFVKAVAAQTGIPRVGSKGTVPDAEGKLPEGETLEGDEPYFKRVIALGHPLESFQPLADAEAAKVQYVLNRTRATGGGKISKQMLSNADAVMASEKFGKFCARNGLTAAIATREEVARKLKALLEAPGAAEKLANL